MQTDVAEFGRLGLSSDSSANGTPPAAETVRKRFAAIEQFRSLEPSARRLVLRLLGRPCEADWEQLAERDDGKDIAEWMLTLPKFEPR